MERQWISIGDNVRLERKDGKARFVCSCEHELGDGADNFKEHCIVKESKVSAIGPGYTSSDPDMADRMIFREFFCPGCGARLSTEVARAGDPYLWDIQFRL